MDKDQAREKLTAERARYMAGEVSHHDYYCWLSDWIGLTDQMIPVTAEEVAGSVDPHLNDIPLRRWDLRDDSVRGMAYRKGIPWSLSDTVCCLKAMAKRRRDRGPCAVGGRNAVEENSGNGA